VISDSTERQSGTYFDIDDYTVTSYGYLVVECPATSVISYLYINGVKVWTGVLSGTLYHEINPIVIPVSPGDVVQPRLDATFNPTAKGKNYANITFYPAK